jgi:predicted nucleic acid-binding protein
MIVADTDVLIDALRGREPMAGRILAALEIDGLCTTAITAFELWSGVTSTKAQEAVEALLAPLILLGVDGEAARVAADVRIVLGRGGRSIGMADSLIAGVCLANGVGLLTRNRKRFERVPGLHVEE